MTCAITRDGVSIMAIKFPVHVLCFIIDKYFNSNDRSAVNNEQHMTVIFENIARLSAMHQNPSGICIFSMATYNR